MAQNFLRLLKPEADVSKNVFDLSRKYVLSSKPGQLLPVLSVETVPGDKFRIDMAAFQRTMTLNTAAFVRGKFKYDFFFVPYVQLWHPFNQFISQRDDKHSTMQQSHNYCPVIPISDTLYCIRQTYIREQGYENYDVFGNNTARQALRLLDLLGYGNFDYILDDDFTDSEFSELQDDLAGVKVNIFRIAAYQHIFYDFYRNKYYDVEDVSENGSSSSTDFYRRYLRLFNFDDIPCNTSSNSDINDVDVQFPSRILAMLTMRYAQWKKDVFTSALPSQQFGAVSSVDINGYFNFTDDGASWNQEVRYVRNLSVIGNGNSDPRRLQATEPSAVSVGHSGTWSMPNAFDVLSFRKAELLQRWKQNTLRAGNMTDDSFKAHYGVEPYYDSDENVRYLGSFESALNINTIEATASTADQINGKVGDVGATGTSVTSGQAINFDCNDFGVIQCIAHFVPDIEYRSDMIDKSNRLFEQFDFFTPEFQNIGLDPVIGADFACSRSQDVSSAFRSGVFGFAPRYWQYKTAVDKCFGEFAHGSLMPWVAPRDQSRVSSVNNYKQVLSNFYVGPNIYDPIFGITSNQDQDTDCFLHNIGFNIKAIRPMSVLGLPEF